MAKKTESILKKIESILAHELDYQAAAEKLMTLTTHEEFNLLANEKMQMFRLGGLLGSYDHRAIGNIQCNAPILSVQGRLTLKSDQPTRSKPLKQIAVEIGALEYYKEMEVGSIRVFEKGLVGVEEEIKKVLEDVKQWEAYSKRNTPALTKRYVQKTLAELTRLVGEIKKLGHADAGLVPRFKRAAAINTFQIKLADLIHKTLKGKKAPWQILNTLDKTILALGMSHSKIASLCNAVNQLKRKYISAEEKATESAQKYIAQAA